MKSSLLHVIMCVSNPLRWDSRIRLAKNAIKHMKDSGVVIHIIECAYGDRPFELDAIEGIHHIGVRARTLLWIKENLLNLAITRLPHDWKYVAFIDADVVFRKSQWASETVHALQLYDVVQPWANCYDLGPDDDHLQEHTSFGRLVQEAKPLSFGKGPYKFGHPGYAWAFTRRALDILGGLIETASLGAADHHMAGALVGQVEQTMPGNVHPNYKRNLFNWQRHAQTNGLTLSYVPGTIEHQWHGSKDNRLYVDRWQILTKHNFDPDQDIKRNIWGVYELSGNKPKLTNEIDQYFRQRNEDSTTL